MPRAVSRIKAKGDLYEMDLLLDVNTDLYPMDVRFLLRHDMSVWRSMSDDVVALEARADSAVLTSVTLLFET